MNSFIKKKPITQTDIQRRVGLVGYYKITDVTCTMDKKA